jgi:DNA-binding MarR family transcriptional regulator
MADSPPKSETAIDQARSTVDFQRGIPFLVSALGNKLSACVSNNVRQNLGVGLMEWRILALLAAEGDVTPARVAQVAGVDKSVVSRAAASLEQRGLIAIATAMSASRQTRLSMTADGEALHDEGMRLANAGNEALLQGFTPEERAQLAELLLRASANLPKLESKPRR